ncbi:hypothetical protein BK004_04810 [bacterium CG10_46_32]|nr:MAG: hypothetical protein BK004_04810 [bacterium CG10_46_32]PIR55693.1 MAG: hypothetical protein COU73_04850 [Parcubacteria group bacterium CG10_big_fil_rev_8_21_14_0_10_46_32]
MVDRGGFAKQKTAAVFVTDRDRQTLVIEWTRRKRSGEALPELEQFLLDKGVTEQQLHSLNGQLEREGVFATLVWHVRNWHRGPAWDPMPVLNYLATTARYDPETVWEMWHDGSITRALRMVSEYS